MNNQKPTGICKCYGAMFLISFTYGEVQNSYSERPEWRLFCVVGCVRKLFRKPTRGRLHSRRGLAWKKPRHLRREGFFCCLECCIRDYASVGLITCKDVTSRTDGLQDLLVKETPRALHGILNSLLFERSFSNIIEQSNIFVTAIS